MKRVRTTTQRAAWVLALLMILTCASGQPVRAKVQAFEPDHLAQLTSATLHWNPENPEFSRLKQGAFTLAIEDSGRLEQLTLLLSEAEEMKAGTKCPFYGEAMLTLQTTTGEQIRLELATDDCTVYKLGERYFNYMPPDFWQESEHPHNELLFDLFTWQEWARGLDFTSRYSIDELYGRWTDFYGKPFTWQMGTWVSFANVFGPAAKRMWQAFPEDAQAGINPLMFEKYAWPGPEDMPFDQAISIAWDAFGSRLGMGPEERNARGIYGVFIKNDPQKPVWKVHAYDGQRVKGTPFAQIDATTGDIQDIGRWPDPLNTVSAFAQGIDPLNPENPAVVLRRLENQYGPQLYWTLEEKAQRLGHKLPGPQDITPDKALALARAALIEGLGLSQKEAEAVPYGVFFVTYQAKDSAAADSYAFTFEVDALNAYAVSVDAITGEIVLLQGPGDANG